MKVAVGSNNPAKLGAVKKALEQIQVIVIGVDVPSGVTAQPFSDQETMQGAIERAKNAKSKASADIGIGLEGGVYQQGNQIYVCNWGALSWEGGILTAGGARIPLPDAIAVKLLQGHELGPIMDEYTQEKGIRYSKGAVGVFTSAWVTREEMFEHVVKLLVGQYMFVQKKEND
ncbi:inosine/xanthosine triphosphatase [Bacillus oleivorans]|uniref:inosine/xanthosine triphosphatase n=1 Tax=Bacillus oleivorans TaxID=1448271 RepID=A0A285CWD0_9BACI|nr:DUF84 family protein [Bacillus oleivorans]SNX71346.1 inosine/xanthosine triphosphatase [Bacillus oleivorans]